MTQTNPAPACRGRGRPIGSVPERPPQAEHPRRHGPPSATNAAEKLRRTSERRRLIDPTTCECDYSDDETDFMKAMDRYKRGEPQAVPDLERSPGGVAVAGLPQGRPSRPTCRAPRSRRPPTPPRRHSRPPVECPGSCEPIRPRTRGGSAVEGAVPPQRLRPQPRSETLAKLKSPYHRGDRLVADRQRNWRKSSGWSCGVRRADRSARRSSTSPTGLRPDRGRPVLTADR